MNGPPLLICQSLLFQIPSEQFPALNFLFITTIPFQSWIYEIFWVCKLCKTTIINQQWFGLYVRSRAIKNRHIYWTTSFLFMKIFVAFPIYRMENTSDVNLTTEHYKYPFVIGTHCTLEHYNAVSVACTAHRYIKILCSYLSC